MSKVSFNLITASGIFLGIFDLVSTRILLMDAKFHLSINKSASAAFPWPDEVFDHYFKLIVMISMAKCVGTDYTLLFIQRHHRIYILMKFITIPHFLILKTAGTASV